MFQIPFELWVAWRYTRKSRGVKRDGFMSFISTISMIAIALGVAALIIVLSVMNGFTKEYRDRMLSVVPHLELYERSTSTSDQPLALIHWQDYLEQAKKASSEVISGAPYMAGEGMLMFQSRLQGIQVRGIDPSQEHHVSDIGQQIIRGNLSSLTSGSFNVVLGKALARTLGVSVGEHVLIMVPQGSISPAGFSPRMRQLNVTGIFESGHYDYDVGLAFLSVDDAAVIFKGVGVGGVRLRIKHVLDAPEVAREISWSMPRNIYTADWTIRHQTWFEAVKTEKRMMFLILALIIGVASFNLLSSLVMTVNDKRSDIAILRTIGASPDRISAIFMLQGSIIGVLGTTIGVILGCLGAIYIEPIVSFIEHVFNFHVLSPEVYKVSTLPSDLQWMDVLWIGIISLILAFLATIYPSIRASKLQPAEVLRHE